ncbi:DEAD/DEAH box helicase [Pseudodesulfovibrio nedwellii]|uniref:DEAD/DEAH box helicase n=1 Tax=Pseudodesulfovibrio nedwellii TaxID=2973072 RepID=A0ABN6RYU2_9BACT|nr:DEAD/DEAH box helicase [Pseudodesulfovibrio nedwellii]BDQ36159.1 DEAD/DEAH box helicase [Pseudodesulfovibrio nedwellii]
MSAFYTKLSNTILSSEGYGAASNELFENYVKKIAGEEHQIEREVVKKLTTSLQYFYQSDDESIRKKGAELLSMLLYVCGEEVNELVVIADHVFNEAGDFPNITLLREKFPNINFKISMFDEVRKDLREALNTVEAIDHPLTDYQRSLWEDLEEGEDVITAAPTSTGKTHIILQYLVREVAQSGGAFAAIVVPTRALISEVSNTVYEIAKKGGFENDIEICTFPKEEAYNSKTIFVMTQERLFETLQADILYFDFLFVDEAHNISDKSRGVLLHMTLQKVLEGGEPQIIISMPSQRYLKAFNSIFDEIEFSERTTKRSPVAKILINTKLVNRDIILSHYKSESQVVIPKNFAGDKLGSIAYRLGSGESNIVYRNKTNNCEDSAKAISDMITKEKDSPRLQEAADYVATFLHQDFTLAENLKKGVAFHYGPLPGVVRRMVESLARDGEIDFIACTSTLAEGVNLPAKNLFLQNPLQVVQFGNPEQIEDVKIDNITGRAGRMLKHFSGNIFLVDLPSWRFQDYFEEKEDEADKIPTYYQILNDNVNGVKQALQGTYDHSTDGQYTYYAIANKLLKEFENDTLSQTLDANEITLQPQVKIDLISQVERSFDELIVDSFTLEANPTVGYLQQNSLYDFLRMRGDLSEWALPHPMSTRLYTQLEKICSELNQFGIFLPTKSSVPFACVIARKWIQGESLHSIILEQMNHWPRKKCNTNVREVIATINSDIRFKMASALRCYQLLFTNITQSRNEEVESVKLHGFIEAGGCDKRFIQLVNIGLSRETAVEINSKLQPDIPIPNFETLRSLYDEDSLSTLHPITKKEIERLLL